MNQPSGNARNKRISNSRQRKQQQHLLDVKLRANTERSRRFRAVFGFIFKLIIFVGLGVGGWIGGKEALRRFVWENPDYFLHEINFATDGALTREQVLTTANIVEGRNIFTLDLGRARAAIEQMPQVESAVVQRVLPNRINITIAERRPIAWVAAKGDDDPSSSDRSFLIDARGIVLRSRVLLPEYFHLPIISGFETENLVPGKRVNVLEMRSWRSNSSGSMPTARAFRPETSISPRATVSSSPTSATPKIITFGLDRLDNQLARLYRCLDRAAEDHKELQTVNLIVERNIPVTFYDPEADAAAAAAAAAEVPPKPAVEVRKAESVTPKAPPKSSTPARGNTGNQSLKKPFHLNP